MATYYVRKSGSDSNNGTSAATAFLTAQKAADSVAAGDHVWFGHGKWVELITLKAAGTALARIYWHADITGVMTGDPGEVILTNSDTDDGTQKSGVASLFDLASYGFQTFEDFTMKEGTWGVFRESSVTAPTDIHIRRCKIFGGTAAIVYQSAAPDNYMAGWIWENNFFFETRGGIGAGSTKIPGIAGNPCIFRHNLVISSGMYMGITNGKYCQTTNNVLIGIGDSTPSFHTTVDATTIARNNVIFYVSGGNLTPSTFFGGATATVSGTRVGCPYFNPFWSDLFTELGAASPVDAGTGIPTTFSTEDAIRTRENEYRPRPNMLGYDAGPIEKNAQVLRETTPVDEGTYSASISGTGYLDFDLPLASSGDVTVTVRLRRDVNYVGRSPSVTLSQSGVTLTQYNGETLNLLLETGDKLLMETADKLLIENDPISSLGAAVDTWETVTLRAVTMSSKGIGRLRVWGYSANPTGKVFIDNFTVT